MIGNESEFIDGFLNQSLCLVILFLIISTFCRIYVQWCLSLWYEYSLQNVFYVNSIMTLVNILSPGVSASDLEIL